jgi:hypothetical protein
MLFLRILEEFFPPGIIEPSETKKVGNGENGGSGD